MRKEGQWWDLAINNRADGEVASSSHEDDSVHVAGEFDVAPDTSRALVVWPWGIGTQSQDQTEIHQSIMDMHGGGSRADDHSRDQ